jgi:uncharacterized membrane protein YkvI
MIFCILGGVVLKKAYNEHVMNLDDLLVPRVGNIASKTIKIITAVFQFFVFVIMISGLKSLLVQAGIDLVVAYVMLMAVLIIIISSDVKRVMTVNSFIAPVIIIGIIVLGITLVILNGKGLHVPSVSYSEIGPNAVTLFGIPSHSWVLSAILYVSFNTLLALPVLSDAGRTLISRRSAVSGGILGGLLIGLMALSTNTALATYTTIIDGKEMPLVYLSFTLGKIVGITYSIIIFFAMLCSASVCGYCTVNRLSSHLKFNKLTNALIVCLLSIPLSWIKFASLIGFFYPLFGIAGLFVLMIVIFK